MRKVMLLAAMLAMVLAAAVPAFAQATAVNEGSDDGQYNANAVCQNIIGSIGDITQTQSGDADAVAVDDSAAAADVAQEQGVTINQVNECLNTLDVDDDGFVAPPEVVVSVSASASASASAPAHGGGSAAAASPSASASAAAVLPETGGASLIALGAGALLVAGGLLARRIVR